LFELADSEFMRLRNLLQDYAEGVALQIEQKPESVLVDSVSLFSFVRNSPLVGELDRRIGLEIGAHSMMLMSKEFVLDYLVRAARHLGITSISGLDEALQDHSEQAVQMAVAFYINHMYSGSVSEGSSLLFLLHYLAVQRMSNAELVAYAQAVMAEDIDPQYVKTMVQKLLAAYRRVTSNAPPAKP
jgi:hypothetical protein